MKFLIINFYDPPILEYLYSSNPFLKNQPYESQLQEHTTEGLFFTSDFYSVNLKKLGHEAYDVVGNSEALQKKWLNERGIRNKSFLPHFLNRFFRKVYRINQREKIAYLKDIINPILPISVYSPHWMYIALYNQIKHVKPDVIINIAMRYIDPAFMTKIKSHTRLLVGVFSGPSLGGLDYRCYDLFFSSLPHYVESLQKKGVPSYLLKLAFEPRILGLLNDGPRSIPISFIGNVTNDHIAGNQLLEYICRELPVQIWGYCDISLPPDSRILRSHMGRPAIGLEAFQILKNSKIVINRHGENSKNFANNLRLYEATGTGALLLTEQKDNLHDIFEPGKEVVTYSTHEECVNLAKYYLEHEEERKAIARAGQERTLREHTYYQRMQELDKITMDYI